MTKKENLNLQENFALALQNHQKGNFKVAENIYKKVLENNPDHFETVFYLGSLYLQMNNFKHAKIYLQRVLSIQPNMPGALINLAITLTELGEYKTSIEHFNKAIKIEPKSSIAHFNLGNALCKLNEYLKAIKHYKQTIDIDENHILAHNNMCIAFIELGKPFEAVMCSRNAISINPNYTLALNNMSILFKETQFLNLSEENNIILKNLMIFLFKRNDINHKDLFRNAKKFLYFEKANINLKEIVNSESILLQNKSILSLLKNELFLLMMQKSLMADMLIEKILLKLRKEFLYNYLNNKKNILEDNINFLISLAEQCFLNEYVYAQTNEEDNFIKSLVDEIIKSDKIDELKIIILGTYVPLANYNNIANKLINYKSKNILFNDLIDMQIKEPFEEKNLSTSIPSLENITNYVSKKVRDQYEKYPYPRWRYTYARSPGSFLKFVSNQIKPNKVEFNNNFQKPNVLIAGCGTGNHICQVANYLNANILAVDLSLASLAYSKRKTTELGISNIEFLQTDILNLSNINRKFDIIESVGVLHHMQDPYKGLSILKDLLEPHGLLLIGLYSEKARQEVIKAKEFVKKNKFANSFSGIRKFREAIFDEKNDLLLKKISNGKDFYSTSSVKDLVFHVQEHRFVLPQVLEMLEKLNLEFLGFCNKIIKNQYAKSFPEDKKNILLNSWNEFEAKEPRAFTGMYTFWVRKNQS